MTPQTENILIQYLGWTGVPPFFICKKPALQNIVGFTKKKFQLSEFSPQLLSNLCVYGSEKSGDTPEGK